MAADPASLRFFVDESLMGIGKALAYAREDVVHAGHALVPDAAAGALDTEWMPAVAARGLAVIARDRRLRTRPGELAAPERATRLLFGGQAGPEQLGLPGPARPALERHRTDTERAGAWPLVHGCARHEGVGSDCVRGRRGSSPCAGTAHKGQYGPADARPRARDPGSLRRHLFLPESWRKQPRAKASRTSPSRREEGCHVVSGDRRGSV